MDILEKITVPPNFLYDIIERDLAEGRHPAVQTRFPPEPNGYLHIGHAKGTLINFIAARKFGGKFNLRYDDTNPLREDDEYVRSIYEDICWLLGREPDNVFYGSDYFGKCYEFAMKLIKEGKAYVCDLTPEEMAEYRGSFTKPGRESPYRNRTAEENLDLFGRMRAGEFPDKSRTLRAKIDMRSPNMNMRDPALYRILHAEHHRQGNKWCIYPMYDYAHPIQDALEGVTHSMCSLEFEDHRPLYDWVVENIGFENPPRQYEFAKISLTYTVLGKRYLREMVETGVVDGWDDPRMPTLSALRRRGFTPTAIADFIFKSGISKVYSVADTRLLEFCQRDELNLSTQRRIAVIDPLPVVIENYPEDKTEEFDLPNHPGDELAGTRKVVFSRNIFIEREDFAENPPPKFFRLKPGGEVRLMGAYIIRCTEVDKDADGKIVRLRCECDPETGGKNPADGRKVKGTVHWLSELGCDRAAVNLYSNLFTAENIAEILGESDYRDYIDPQSKKTFADALVEKSLTEALPGERFQFVRLGYFYKDMKASGVYNRIITLKDGYKPS